MVEPPQAAVEPTSAAELMDLEEQAHQARFREMRAKIAQDMSNMTAYNAQATENQRRNHVVHVMHERVKHCSPPWNDKVFILETYII